MDEFDFKEEKPRKPKGKFGSAVLNVGSLLALLASLCSGGYFLQLFLDPESEWNPLPPVTATIAPTQTSVLPTATLEPTAEATAQPSATPEPSPTVQPLIYNLQDGSPAYLDATLFRPEQACNFMGVFGQVFGVDDAPLTGVRVQVAGTLNNEAVDKLGLTGAATQYGAGAYYEIQLGNAPLASENALQIVLLNENGEPLSSSTAFNTRGECSQNLILINFKQIP